MLSVAEALDLVLSHLQPVPVASQRLGQALGCVLGEDVAADVDLPPFDKALVDGYAVRTPDLKANGSSLSRGEVITAGQVPTRPLGAREAAVIMTGAPVPAGADAVVMHERTRAQDGAVWIDEPDVRPGQNILRRGREVRSGEIVLLAGSVLNPARLGLLASQGRAQVRVCQPTVVVLPTGDELVEPHEVPGPGKIRNSNTVMLHSLASCDGARAESLPVAPDDPASLRASLAHGLGADLLIISGGVSAGQKDLVPASLLDLGVRRVLHKVRLKPGKPLWFGVGPERGLAPGTLVFGLPGNPVSSLVCYLLFIRPALGMLGRRPQHRPQFVRARLVRRFEHRGDRPTYFPSRCVSGGGDHDIETLDWSGSADLCTVAHADGFAVFPAGDRDYPAGEIVDFLPMG